MHRRSRYALLAAALLLAACDQPAGGGGGPSLANPPETAAREIALGQPVNESLESATDVDDFTLNVPAAGRGMALIVGTGTGQGTISVTVLDSATNVLLGTATAHGTDEGGYRFDLPAGRLLVRVASTGTTGSYRFTIHAIATAPESGEGPSAARQWAAGDMVPYYDVDEYAFDGVQGQDVKLYLEVSRELGGPAMQAVLRGPAPGRDVIVTSHTWLSFGESEPVRLPATGRYTLSVSTPDPAEARAAGPYRVMVFPIDRAPEGVPAELQHNQPVSEVLDMDADVDEYTFQAAQGEMFLLFAELLPPGGSGYFHLIDPATNAIQIWQGLNGPTAHSGLPRWTAPHAGPFTFRASAGKSPYRLGMFRVDTRPEQVPAAIAIGQTVEGESMDPAGEVDVFEFSGAAGTQLAIMTQAPGGLPMEVVPLHDTTRLAYVVAQAGAAMEDNTSARFTLPVDGTYRVRMIFQPPEGSTSRGPAGAYRFQVAPIRYAPESVPAAIELDQTVTGESLEHRSDVDVFTFHGQAGELITLWGNRLAPDGHLRMTLYRPGTAGSPGTEMTTFEMTGHASWLIGLPVTGEYRVQVLSPSVDVLDPMSTGTYRGAYELAVRRAN
jgi:hypothetical protein